MQMGRPIIKVTRAIEGLSKLEHKRTILYLTSKQDIQRRPITGLLIRGAAIDCQRKRHGHCDVNSVIIAPLLDVYLCTMCT
jgi:hypothetical protein